MSHFFPAPTPDATQHTETIAFVNDSLSCSYEPLLISAVELDNAMAALRCTTTPGPDGFSAAWLKIAYPLLKAHFLSILKVCIKIGFFPSAWRSASIFVLKKPGKSCYLSANSFRGISILNAFAKAFEIVIHNKLKLLACEHNWFSDSQHGFRPNKSTESACGSLISLIEKNKKQKITTCCAFLDIKSAFDAAWHPAILKGLIKKGCPVPLVKLIKSFLSSRLGHLRSSISLSIKIALGCPQGSTLSPFLWNILLEELLSFVFPFPFVIIAYADDLVLCTFDKDPTLACRNLQLMCAAAEEWGSLVKLSFNATKSVLMIFYAARFTLSLSIIIGGVTIVPSVTCTYLGLIIDSKLSWHAHIEAKCAASKKLLFFILKCCRLTWGLSRKVLSLLYKTVFLPTILYNCAVWAGAVGKKKVLKALLAAQRPFAIAIARLYKTTSTSAALVLANTTPLHLKILEITTKRALGPSADNLPPSALRLVAVSVADISNSPTPTGVSLGLHRRRLLDAATASKWDILWQQSETAGQTGLFFPKIAYAHVLWNDALPFCIARVISGHCGLNGFLSKIGVRSSPACCCGEQIETFDHFLFHCPIWDTLRTPFKKAITDSNCCWPPKLADIPRINNVWSVFISLICASKRFRTYIKS